MKSFFRGNKSFKGRKRLGFLLRKGHEKVSAFDRRALVVKSIQLDCWIKKLFQ